MCVTMVVCRQRALERREKRDQQRIRRMERQDEAGLAAAKQQAGSKAEVRLWGGMSVCGWVK